MDLVSFGATAAKIGFVLAIVFTFAPLLIWAERRQSAMMQDRIGPVRAGIKLFGVNITLLGLLHPLADAMKLVWKEDFIPPKADKLLHAAAPLIALIPALSTFAVIPFGDTFYMPHNPLSWAAWDISLPAFGTGMEHDPGYLAIPLQVASVNVGILYMFAIAGTGVVGAAIAGYSSDNKYSLLGGIRAAGQMVSYEVTLGLALVGVFMVYGSLRLEDMVHWQTSHDLFRFFGAGPHTSGLNLWGIFVQPAAFVLFFTASIAETKRIPFDVPEGESELVGGYFTEYSGMKWGIFFMGEFVEVITSSALIATLFLGGYDLPFLQADGFNVFGLHGITFPWVGDTHYYWSWSLDHWIVTLLQVATFVLKLAFMIWLQLTIRWSLPRFRYDQIMKLCWKILLPLSLANILITGILILLHQTLAN